MTYRTSARLISFISFLAFPVTLNFFSPYVSIDAALSGLIAGSLALFGVMFLTGLVFRRSWCTFVCPWAAPSEYLLKVQGRRVNRRRLAFVRYTVFGIWAAAVVAAFVSAGGIAGFVPLYLTESGISVDMPVKYITYYGVVALLFALTVLVGRRGACQSICWMSPFLVAGTWLGQKLGLPQWKVNANPEACIACKACDKACPMSLEVSTLLKAGSISSLDCIQCNACVEACPKRVLRLGFHRGK